MKKTPSNIGPSELAILRFVVDNHPATVREVADHVANTTGQARTTVLTLMERLRKKKLLTRRKVKGVNRYSPRITRSELMHSLVNDFVGDVLGGSVSPFLAYLTENSSFSEEEVRELRRLVDNLPSDKQCE